MSISKNDVFNVIPGCVRMSQPKNMYRHYPGKRLPESQYMTAKYVV